MQRSAKAFCPQAIKIKEKKFRISFRLHFTETRLLAFVLLFRNVGGIVMQVSVYVSTFLPFEGFLKQVK